MPPRSIRPLQASDLNGSNGVLIYSAPSRQGSAQPSKTGQKETTSKSQTTSSGSSKPGVARVTEEQRGLGLGGSKHRKS